MSFIYSRDEMEDYYHRCREIKMLYWKAEILLLKHRLSKSKAKSKGVGDAPFAKTRPIAR